ncbi:zinc-finger domain-containing protein [Phocicoccus pinnipedialis]|uniref:Zinc-finger domain-containing protein n=1 Tax=Phocicoccus pinnipedialis TaxID=110845 RepID=A0A6V7REJ5_9BACL|nr:zinc-finger domain-containing protein [Jeotgalicoccus pinnipedialis]MBP1939397.1 hypothetical protein [Jeotgalicoccus pinnipedialis]CAD2075528.1 hypothetical protein JEOPIN946_01043 [Jeotgalicoccus pinnipedialis]
MNTEVLKKITTLETRFCKNCPLKEFNRDKYSKTYAHHFCINECSVGITIKSHGNNL